MMEKTVIFIVGNSRSGTTMLGRILGNHPSIYTFGELHFFEQLVDVSKIGMKQIEDNELISILERLFTTAREGLFKRVIPGRYRDEAKRLYR